MTPSVHYSDDAVTLWHGDARRVSEFIAADSVDLLVTSPPYFALRSYTDDGEHYDGQMGSEATPREFVDNLIAATADWAKVVKRTGSILDPFLGTGTTLLTARALGRAGHGVDLSKDYLRLAQWRIWNDDATYRKVRTRSNIATPKAPAIDGQMSLLDGAA